MHLPNTYNWSTTVATKGRTGYRRYYFCTCGTQYYSHQIYLLDSFENESCPQCLNTQFVDIGEYLKFLRETKPNLYYIEAPYADIRFYETDEYFGLKYYLDLPSVTSGDENIVSADWTLVYTLRFDKEHLNEKFSKSIFDRYVIYYDDMLWYPIPNDAYNIEKVTHFQGNNKISKSMGSEILYEKIKEYISFCLHCI